jgi:hypothetical protein
VNAWTTSRVQRSLLGLFCRCEASLPNFWVGALTHDSVNSALSQGISAEEIISYLQVGMTGEKGGGGRSHMCSEIATGAVACWV